MNALTQLREWNASLPPPRWPDFLMTLLLGFWQAARERAEDPQRRVPYC